MRPLLALALLLTAAGCERAEAPPSSAGTENPDVLTPAETPPSAAIDDTSRLPDQPLLLEEDGALADEPAP